MVQEQEKLVPTAICMLSLLKEQTLKCVQLLFVSVTVRKHPAAQTEEAQPCLRQLPAPDPAARAQPPLSRPPPLDLPTGAGHSFDSREEKLLMCFYLQ